MTPDVNKFGRLIAGWDPITKRGAICSACGKGGSYLIGEPGEERHMGCWDEAPRVTRKRPDPGPRLFDPDGK